MWFLSSTIWLPARLHVSYRFRSVVRGIWVCVDSQTKDMMGSGGLTKSVQNDMKIEQSTFPQPRILETIPIIFSIVPDILPSYSYRCISFPCGVIDDGGA